MKSLSFTVRMNIGEVTPSSESYATFWTPLENSVLKNVRRTVYPMTARSHPRPSSETNVRSRFAFSSLPWYSPSTRR